MSEMFEIAERGFCNKCTFWKLISTYNIEIPIIQRDYAQGRSSENVSAIRSELLKSIYNAIVCDNPLNFDFVYGSVEGNTLFPLDGQQRLTTFFLLHWYLSEKENRIEETRETLSKFSYSTRISSREFCNMLVNIDYTPEKDIHVSTYIKNQNKYFSSWNNDPTIKAMLVMLDEIHLKFYESEPLLDKLINEDLSILTFSYLSMEHYSLTDDLYIKMNARGKPLSNFENFKAKFIQHLKEKSLPYHYFEEAIDGKWTDLLWDYRSYDNTIDKPFMNLFFYLTDMIFLMNESSYDGDSPFRQKDDAGIRKIVNYYDTEEKVNLFYSLMDLWNDKNDVNTYLTTILTDQRKKGKVCIFESNVDIFSDIVNDKNVTVINKILLFSIMIRLLKLGKDTDVSNVIDYVRIVRNFLIKVRFFDKKNTRYTADFRFGRQGVPYVSFISNYLADSQDPYQIIKEDYCDDYEGINSEIYKQESYKAKIILEKPHLKDIIQGLEDLKVFKSSIFNIVDYAVEYQYETIIDDIETIFDKKNSDKIVPALLSVSDYSIKVGGTYLGEKIFLGNKDNWYDIATYSDGKSYTKFFSDFIKQYHEIKIQNNSVEETLENIVKENLGRISKRDWRYCLIKYPSTTKEPMGFTNRNLVFAVETAKRTILHRMNGKTLNGYHVIPEYIEVANQLGKKSIYDIYGLNSYDSGSVKLDGFNNVSIYLNSNYDIPKVSIADDTDKALTREIEEEYSKFDVSNADTVEQMLIMANLVNDKFANFD